MGSSASLVHKRGGEAGGYSLDSSLTRALELHPPPSLKHTHTFKHSLPVCWSVVEEVVCRWLLIGPQGLGRGVIGDTVVRLFMCSRHMERLGRMAKV